MRDSRGLLILLAAVVVIAGVVWWLTRPQPVTVVPVISEEGPIRFEFVDPKVKSPDLEISDVEVRGAHRAGFTSWAVTMTCAEPDGCVGKLVLVVEYSAGGDDGRVLIVDRVDQSEGGKLRFEGIEDPGLEVDGIEEITLEVRDRQPPSTSEAMVFD